ncbi:MAG: aminotransferase class III-fold pyridoxal phosphate-dependent enzyme [Chloroflexi bacterium]|nr:aminotransferase class III-fold pyridoxal phosphate-dependent enzyme [Chloroflexota bacterium]
MSTPWLDRYGAQRPAARALYAEAKGLIAGGVGHDMRYSPVGPIYIDHAAGSHKWDIDGNEYIDYGMGNAALLLGHAPPAVLKAIQDALGKGFHFGNDHAPMVEWARLIHDLVPAAEKIRFVNSGTEGSMLALRLARACTARNKVLRFEGHFSGWHDYVGRGAMVPFDKPVSLGIPAATLDTIVVIPADLAQLEATLQQDQEIAAIMLEPSGASWGTVPLTIEFNRELRRLATIYNVILIFDEVITGFRYSSGGYQVYSGVTPDMAIFGKIIAGGLPGGAVVGRADIMQFFDYTGEPQHDRYGRVTHQGTFNANPLSTAAGIATLRIAATGAPQQHADRLAQMCRQGMEEILEREQAAAYVYGDASIFHIYIEEYPGSGAPSRAALRTDKAAKLKGIPGRVVTALQKNLQIRGVDLLSYTGGVTSAAHTEEDIIKTLGVFQETIRTLLDEKVIGRVG